MSSLRKRLVIIQLLLEELLYMVEHELLAPHLHETFGMPFVEHSRHVESSDIEQSGQVFHPHAQYLGALQGGAKVADEVGEPSLNLLWADTPCPFVELLGFVAELVEEIYAEHLVRVQHGIEVLLVDSEQRCCMVCPVGGLVAWAASKQRVWLYDHRSVVQLHQRECTAGGCCLRFQFATEQEYQLAARLTLREDRVLVLDLQKVKLRPLDDLRQLGSAHALKQGQPQQRVIH